MINLQDFGWLDTILTAVISIVTGLFAAIRLYVKPMEEKIERIEQVVAANSEKTNKQEVTLERFYAEAEERGRILNNIARDIEKAVDTLNATSERIEEKNQARMLAVEDKVNSIEKQLIEICGLMKNQGITRE